MEDDQRPPASPIVTDLKRTDMQAMLTYIQGARIVSMAREIAISRLKGWLIGRLWFGLASAVVVVLAAGLVFGQDAYLISALVLVILAARGGAIVSIGRRMNQDNLGIGTTGDSVFMLASLGSGRNGVALALLSSSVFGLVTLALFASGIPKVFGLSGGIAPVFRDAALDESRDRAAVDAQNAATLKADADRCAEQAPASAATACAATRQVAEAGAMTAKISAAAAMATAAAVTKETCSERVRCDQDIFARLAKALRLQGTPELFKLLVWAFIAGFFEKLVPDMLDSLAARSKANQAKEDAAGK